MAFRLALAAATAVVARALDNGLGRTPQMGWNCECPKIPF